MKVTIGIPTYNQQKYIEAAVESALSQDYPELEVVVADDCSTDGTETLLKKYAADARFRYHRNEKNLGRIGNYRNLLYTLALGDWYLNLDGDDVLVNPCYIRECMNLAASFEDLVLVYAIKDQVKEDFFSSEASCPPKGPYRHTVWEGKDFFFSIPRMRKNRLNHLTCLYERKTAMAIDFYRREIISADLESLFRLTLRGKVGFLDIQAGAWRKHDRNVSTTTAISELMRNFTLFTSVADFARVELPEESRRLDGWLVDNVARKLYTNLLTLTGERKFGEAVKLINYCAKLNRKAVCKTLINPKLYVRILLNVFRKRKL